MHSAMEPARNLSNLAPREDPACSLLSIAADMMSVIIHAQASARLIDFNAAAAAPMSMIAPTWWF